MWVIVACCWMPSLKAFIESGEWLAIAERKVVLGNRPFLTLVDGFGKAHPITSMVLILAGFCLRMGQWSLWGRNPVLLDVIELMLETVTARRVDGFWVQYLLVLAEEHFPLPWPGLLSWSPLFSWYSFNPSWLGSEQSKALNHQKDAAKVGSLHFYLFLVLL